MLGNPNCCSAETIIYYMYGGVQSDSSEKLHLETSRAIETSCVETRYADFTSYCQLFFVPFNHIVKRKETARL